jgi:NhaP-type Na+/H+ or K+/H+ antiporter
LNRLELLWSESFFAGSIAQLIARLTGLPAVVLLLTVGLVIGRAGFNLVEPETLGRGLQPLVGLLVSLVLFDGGLNLRLAGRDLQRTVVQLVVVRGVLGLLGGALLAHQLAGLAWPLAWVFAAISLATGPTVVTPMVQQMRLLPSLGQILQAEGLILEPIGAVLALLLLQLALGDLAGWADVVSLLGLRVGGGVAIGASGGLLLSLVLENLPRGSGPEQDDPLPLQLILGALFLLVSGTEWLLPEAGFPAAVAAGVVVGLRLDQQATQLNELIAQLAQLAITVLFPLLAADLSWAELSPLGLGGVGCVLALMLYRWIVIQLGSIGLPGLGWSEKLILSWIAPRGVVTAAVASLFALQLEAAGVAGASDLKGLVFLMIVLTVGLQGLTAPSLARRLGLVLEPEPQALAIDPLAGGASPAVGAPPDGVKEPTPQGESAEASP